MAHDDHSAHHVNYLYVFGALCVFTGLSVAFDVVELSYPVTVVLVLAVAVAKALCVMMFFMHLKFEGNWKYILLAPTTILAIGLPLALLPDIGVAYYTTAAPQIDWDDDMEEYRALHHGEDGHVEDGHGDDHSDESHDQEAPKEGATPDEPNPAPPEDA